jgi:hypothetical protein
LGLEVPETARGKGIGQSLQAQVMQDFPEMMGQVSSKAAGKTAYRLGRRPPNEPNASLDDVYKIMDENSSVNLVSPEMQKRFMPEGGLLGQAKPASALPTDYYELNTMATQAYTDLRANPSQQTSDIYKSIMKARDDAPNNPSKNYEPPVPDVVTEGYQGQHLAPTKDGGAPLWDMKGIYPDDFYSPQGVQYYGDGAEPARDAMIVRQMQSMKGRPNSEVTIYRAVPKSVPTKEALNTGDWITLDRQYAKDHGEGALNGDYKIIRKTVRARDLFTNGDSIYEMGYDPQPFISTRKTNLLD